MASKEMESQQFVYDSVNKYLSKQNYFFVKAKNDTKTQVLNNYYAFLQRYHVIKEYIMLFYLPDNMNMYFEFKSMFDNHLKEAQILLNSFMDNLPKTKKRGGKK